MNMKSGKTTELPKPETTIVADVRLTFVINDQVNANEAKEIINDIIGNTVDALGNDKVWDNVEFKDLKVFQKEVTR